MTYRDCPKTQAGTPTSPSSGATASTVPAPAGSAASAIRYRFHQSERSETNQSEPSACHSGWAIESSRPPATTRGGPRTHPSGPLESGATTSSVPSHGMSGWFHCSQHRARPSGLTRGAATKSGPVTRTTGSPPASASTATISLAASVRPGRPCSSRTQMIQRPSTLMTPSA